MTDTYTPVLRDKDILEPLQPLGIKGYRSTALQAGRAIERAAIEAYQRQQWRPIETAPKDGTRIIVYRALEPGYEHELIGFDMWRNGNWYRSRRAMRPTHWQPLPPPPEQST